MNEEMLLGLYELLLRWNAELYCDNYSGDLWFSVDGQDFPLNEIDCGRLLTAKNIKDYLQTRVANAKEESDRLDKIRTQMEIIQDSRPKEVANEN